MAGMKKSISQAEERKLMDDAVHTQHKDYDKFKASMGGGEIINKTMKKKVIVPTTEEVTVPVVRKEKKKTVERVTLKSTKLVPVTKYKKVEETVLEVQEEVINGHKEKRAVPVKRLRNVPYTDFEEKEVEIVVDVPKEQIVTRHGTRIDKHVVSRLVEVEEDHVYEMRPVLIKKGETRMKNGPEHHTFKAMHGKPVWGDIEEGWMTRSGTPRHRPDLERPSTAGSVRSHASSMYVPAISRTKIATPKTHNKMSKSLSTGTMRKYLERMDE